jgi:transcriptional regulator with XRE-family HTH domain
LKLIRERLGLTQSQFGQLLGGIDGTSVSRRERTQSGRFEWEELVQLDRALAERGLRLSDFADDGYQQTETP